MRKAHPGPHRKTVTYLLRAALAERRDHGDTITLDTLLDSLRGRAYGVLLIFLAAPCFIPLPIGAVAGFGVVLLGLQMLLGLRQPWVPARLRARQLSRHTISRFLQRIRPTTRRLERLCKPRLDRLTQPWWARVSGLILILLGILLALPIPFTNYLFGAVLLFFAFALAERDGMLIILTWLASSAIMASFVALGYVLTDVF